MGGRRGRAAGAAASALCLVALTGCGGAPDADASDRPRSSASPSTRPSTSAAPSTSAEPSTPPAPPPFDRARLSIDDPASIWVVSDKLRPLNPIDHVPADLVETPVATVNRPTLRAEAADAVVRMFEAAATEGAGGMQLQSAYRSYATQVSVYNGYVASLGRETADAQSARPGHSEHQTGLAVDISPVPARCMLEACFGETPQGLWLAANAYRFGFVLRYPAGAEPVTGFIYEPWHFRYVGVELAAELRATGTATLEEFFGLPAAPDYAGG